MTKRLSTAVVIAICNLWTSSYIGGRRSGRQLVDSYLRKTDAHLDPCGAADVAPYVVRSLLRESERDGTTLLLPFNSTTTQQNITITGASTAGKSEWYHYTYRSESEWLYLSNYNLTRTSNSSAFTKIITILAQYAIRLFYQIVQWLSMFEEAVTYQLDAFSAIAAELRY